MNDEDDEKQIHLNDLYARLRSELDAELGGIVHLDDTLSMEGKPDGVPVVPTGTFCNADPAMEVYPASYAQQMNDYHVIAIADQIKAALVDCSETGGIVARKLLHECALTMTKEQWKQLADILEFDPGQEKWKTVF